MSEIDKFYKLPQKNDLARKLKYVVWLLTVAVLGLVSLMQRIKFPLPPNFDISFLPSFHAYLNSFAALFLLSALGAIKSGKVLLHRRLIYCAFVCSFVFLLSYVIYHFTNPTTIYGDSNGDGLLSEIEKDMVSGTRGIYLFILISHITLAAISFPFILFTVSYSLTNQFAKHKKIARFVFPVWLYVALTGPIIYFFLRDYYLR